MRIRYPLFLLCLLFSGAPFASSVLQAQSCFGNASFARNHLQMNGDVVLTRDLEELGASFVSSSNSVFAGLGLVSRAVDGGDASVAITGNLGYQVPVSRSRSVQVCPVLRASVGLPAKDYNGLGGELRTQSYGLGLNLGAELIRAERVALVPSLSIGVQRDVTTISGGTAPDNIQDTYAYAGVALGIVVNNALSLRPSVMFPLEARLDSPIVGVGLALNFGGRR